MTFRKNVFVAFASISLVLIAAWLVGLERGDIVDGVTLWLAATVITLAIEDLMRKGAEAKDKLTWQYFVGFWLIVCSVVAFLWASGSVTNIEMVGRLGTAGFLSFLGAIWFSIIYKRSVLDERELAEERWAKIYAKIEKATPENQAKVIAKNLRHRLVGDTLAGPVDFEHPLALYEGRCLTYAEACKIEPAKDEEGNIVEDDPIIKIRERALRYITALTAKQEV